MAQFWRQDQLVQTPKIIIKELKRRELMIWETNMQARVQGIMVQLKNSICSKLVQIGY
jgi:hypothetical protein